MTLREVVMRIGFEAIQNASTTRQTWVKLRLMGRLDRPWEMLAERSALRYLAGSRFEAVPIDRLPNEHRQGGKYD
jgi:hypothetical protein